MPNIIHQQSIDINYKIQFIKINLEKNFGDSVPNELIEHFANQIGQTASDYWDQQQELGLSNDDCARKLLDIIEISTLTYSEIFESQTGQKIACQKGCSHCCKGEKIEVSWREVRDILKSILSLDNETKKIIKEQSIAYNKTKNFKKGIGSPCALLVNDSCSIYSNRPITCRGLISADLQSCLNRYSHGGEVPEMIYARAIEYAFAINTREIFDGRYEINNVLKFLFKSNNDLENYINEKIPQPHGLLEKKRIPIKII